MPEHFADRLISAVERKGSAVCIGIDPDYDRLPAELRGENPSPRQQVEAIGSFCRELLGVVAPIVPAVKVQSAYFEVYQQMGVEAYFDVIRHARELGLMVIGDVKRNDIGSTARAYAAGHLAVSQAADAITVNGYFGADGLQPFIEAARAGGRGIFVLVRTSNPSAGSIQDFSDAAGKKFYEHIAEQLATIGSGEALVGECGYSCLGAVVGATYPAEARRLREIMPQQIFLVPGYGAQGAAASDCAAAFKPDGTGAIVNAGRSVIYAFQDDKYVEWNWRDAVAEAARGFADDIRNALGK